MIFLIGMIRTLLGEYTCSEVENSDEDEVQNTKRFKKNWSERHNCHTGNCFLSFNIK